jgi:hypothetical protein
VKRTGGAFDPGVRPLYFAAGATTALPLSDQMPASVLIAVNEIMTEKAERVALGWPVESGRRVLLDSGIFAMTQRHRREHGISMDEALALAPSEIDGFAELHARYCQLVDRWGDRLWGYIELDQGGAVNKRETRAGLEAAGLAPIPVYHPLNDGWAYFDELACGYDRICFGNIVNASQALRQRLLLTLWERHRAYPGLWVHVLGLARDPICLAAPVESCDTTSWLGMLRYFNQHTESAMLRSTDGLGLSFRAQTGGGVAGRRHADAAMLAAEALSYTNEIWAHAAARIAAELGQGALPGYAEGEVLPYARG